jgi:ATP-dependent Clp protease ATP-binding subunit ClpA
MQRLKAKCDEALSNVAFKFNLRPCHVDEYIVFDPLTFAQIRTIVVQQVERVRLRLADRKMGQGCTLVHISAQPEPILVMKAPANVHFSAQPQPILRLKHTT